jgi:uncharacterized peroxidase-related enzyme
MSAPPPRLTVEPEPFIPYVPDAEVVNRLRATVEPYMKRMGFLPNALKLYAHRPEIAETLFKLNSNIMRDPSSTLDQFLKRKLSAVASRANGCTYCTAHCCSMLIRSSEMGPEGWGLSESEVQDLLSGDYQPKDELERVAIDFVVAASTDPSNVSEEILERLKQHLTPPQIVELACVVGFWKFYNTVHDSLHIPLESSLLGDSGWVDV